MTRLVVEDLRRPLESPIFTKFAKSDSFRGRVRFYSLFDAKQHNTVAKIR